MASAPFGKPLPARKSRRNRSSCLPVSGLAVLVSLGIFVMLGLAFTTLRQHDTDVRRFSVQRRNLREEATTGSSNAALRKSPDQDAVWAPLPGYRHTLAVLTGSGSGGSPSWDANALLAAAQKVLDPVGVTWYHGTEAATLAGWVGAEKLPAVVYMRPHCMPVSCEPPPVLELTTGGDSGEATSPDGVVQWTHGHHRQPILLSNDHPSYRFEYAHVPNPNRPHEGKPLGTFQLPPHGRQWIETPLGANWVAWPMGDDSKGPDEAPWIQKKVKGDTHFVVRNPDECNLFADMGCRLPPPVPPEQTPRLLKAREGNFARLLNDIREQKKVTPRFTKAGYKKTRAPPLMYNLLREFFEKHKNDSVNEIWTPDNIYVNHEASRFMLVDLPELGSMKPTLYELMRPVMEEWDGGVPLVPSAIYGIRIYTEGSILQDHADRADTHIISAIINVDQDLDEPWPLDIIGHGGKLTKVTMKPGDMVLYEGASCAHGRPSPLVGRYMANVFLHMRPRDKQPAYTGPVFATEDSTQRR